MSAIQTLYRRIPLTIWLVALVIIAILLPLPLDNYMRAVMWTAGIYVLLGLSLNIIVGYAGQFQNFFAVTHCIECPGPCADCPEPYVF